MALVVMVAILNLRLFTFFILQADSARTAGTWKMILGIGFAPFMKKSRRR